MSLHPTDSGFAPDADRPAPQGWVKVVEPTHDGLLVSYYPAPEPEAWRTGRT